MKKLKTPTAVTTSVLTLITIFFWAGFEIYRAITAKPAPVVPPAVINPLDPNLDTKTLDSLPQRIFFTESEIPNKATATTPATSTPTPAATASATPTSSPSGTLATNSPVPTSTP